MDLVAYVLLVLCVCACECKHFVFVLLLEYMYYFSTTVWSLDWNGQLPFCACPFYKSVDKSSIWLSSFSLARSFQIIHLYSYSDSVLTSFLHTMSNKFQFHNNLQLDFKMEFRIQQKFNYNSNVIVFRSSALTNSVHTFEPYIPVPRMDGVCVFISISWQTFSRCLAFFSAYSFSHHKQLEIG